MRQGHGTFRFRRIAAHRGRAVVFTAAATVVGLSAVAMGVTPSAAAGSKVSASAASSAVQYIGGKAGAANSKKSPISIGWVSDETAITGHPGNTAGVKAAVALINNNLGGIGGHPVKLVPCYITTSDSQGAQCAQEMLNNSSVKVVLEGELLTGEASFIGTMAGAKPVIGVFTQPSVMTQNAYYLDGGIPSQLASVTYIAKVLNAKNVAVLGPNLPGVSAALGMFKMLFGVLGVNATVVLYPSSSTDVEAPIAAANAQTSDAIFLATSTTGECIAVAKACGLAVGLHRAGREERPRRLPEVELRLHEPQPAGVAHRDLADGDLRRRHGGAGRHQARQQRLRPAHLRCGADRGQVDQPARPDVVHLGIDRHDGRRLHRPHVPR